MKSTISILLKEIHYQELIEQDMVCSAGLDLISNNFAINAFNISFTVEADDILVSRDTTGHSELSINT